MNTNCDIVRDLLPLVEDGVASRATVVFVREHLHHCQDCRHYRNTAKTAKSQNSADAPAERVAGLPYTVSPEERKEFLATTGYAAIARRYRRRRTLRIAATVAVCTLCAIGALGTLLKSGDGSDGAR